MKILVLGAAGMAGHTIALYFKEHAYDVVGLARRSVKYVDSIIEDVKNLDRIRNIIENGNFDIVINCIGILNQFAEENKSDAVLLNSYFPHFLAEITKSLKTRIIHMSTDCVFSGKEGNYTEKSFCDGTSFYDRTKALGELIDNKNLTFRNSIVGPDMNENGIGLLNWFMKQKETVNGYTGAMWTGMTTLQTAKMMEKAIEKNVTGLINMVPGENISKYELLKLFNHYLRQDEIEIVPFDDFQLDKTLIRTNFEFDELVPDYRTMIREMSEWMKEHKDLYPHYKL